MKQIAYVFAVVMMLGTVLPVSAGESVWEGYILDKDRNRDVPIVLKLATPKGPGEIGGKVRFQEHWKCGFDLEVTKPQDKTDVYSLDGAPVSFCKHLELGLLKSTPSGDGKLSIQLLDKENKVLFTSDLTRSASPK